MVAKKRDIERVISEIILRQAFEGTVSSLARLIAYASSEVEMRAFDIVKRQDAMALDDLIAFAINARRLIEISGFRKVIDSTKFPVWKVSMRLNAVEFSTTQKTVSFWKILNSIIHSIHIEVFRSDIEAAISQRLKHFSVEEIIDRKSISPKCYIQTDRKEKLLLDLKEIMLFFENSILNRLVEYYEEKEIYLSAVWSD